MVLIFLKCEISACRSVTCSMLRIPGKTVKKSSQCAHPIIDRQEYHHLQTLLCHPDSSEMKGQNKTGYCGRRGWKRENHKGNLKNGTAFSS